MAGRSARGTDRLRLMGWPAPIGAFFYTLFVKGCLLDGWAGWYYVLQRVIAALVGSGGSCPVARARVAAGPQKFPVHAAGFIQSVASVAPCSEFPSVITK